MTVLTQRPRSGGQLRPETRKPRLLIGGEFSAGKTRLLNGLLGADILPSNVTATALPAVWLKAGPAACHAIDLQGTAHRVDAPGDAPLEETQFYVLSHPAPLLNAFDIIDTPGHSDPNMPPESWQRMLDYADAVIWCSNATQAWRQSEKSVWVEMPERLLRRATLLITHADKMPDERSAERVLRRVRRDAQRYFESFLMEALLEERGLSRVREHLVTEMAALEELGGAALSAQAEPVQGAAPAPEQETVAAEVAPRRITRVRPGSRGQAQTPEQPGRRREPSRDVRKTAGAGSARDLWRNLSKGMDASDAQAVLACVERFLDTLDGPESAANSSPRDLRAGAGEQGAADRLIQEIMHGRSS